MRLSGKIAIVTGAGTGIGEAIAHKFAREGASLVLAGLPDDPVEDVAGAIIAKGGAAMVFAGDLFEPAADPYMDLKVSMSVASTASKERLISSSRRSSPCGSPPGSHRQP